jgi:hypothetical protein
MTGKWLSKPAVLWVLYDAGNVPAHLLSTLIVYAVYAGTDGRGAHPSLSTVGLLTRKSERGAKYNVAELVKLGLLLPGDARIVSHIRPDRRPAVYDLPMPRGAVGFTPSSPNGVQSPAERGAKVRQNGVQPASPEEVLKTSGRRARDRAGARPPHAEPQPPRAPPCQICGEPFSPDLLANAEFRALALAGGVVHLECTDEDVDRPELIARVRAAYAGARP